MEFDCSLFLQDICFSFLTNAVFIPALCGMCLVVVIGCVHSWCPVCCSFLAGTGGCIQGACEDGRRESRAQWECGCGHTHAVPCRAWPAGLCDSPRPAAPHTALESPQGQNLLCYTATSGGLGYPGSGWALLLCWAGFSSWQSNLLAPELRGCFCLSSMRALTDSWLCDNTCCVVGRACDGDLCVSWWGHTCTWLQFGHWPSTKCVSSCFSGCLLL